MKRRWRELIGALTLLTRLPVGGLARFAPPAACVWAYPLAGLLVGGIGAAVLAGLRGAGLSQPLAAVLALLATTLATGGLHEDGLADTADGFGGGRTREAKLAIMRDSRIGSFGALALLFSLAVRVAALAASPHPARALLLAAMLGRAAMLLPLLLLRPARAGGLAAPLAQARPRVLAAGLLATLPAAIAAPRATIAALLAGVATALLARRTLGGFTGDVLGAAEQMAECSSLACL